jgi:bifunctional DNA-binding transcriptional regulator/antitoxin component of YhaV-PrlF toxin-antitoxin module
LLRPGAWSNFLIMTTTINVSAEGQVELPADFCRRKKIKPGTALRVTEVGEGVYVTPLPEPSEKELREVIAAAGSLTRRQTPADEAMVQEAIAGYRAKKRRKR